MRVAARILLTSDQRVELERFARGRKTQARLVLRPGSYFWLGRRTDLEIAERLSVVPRTAARWRARFLKEARPG